MGTSRRPFSLFPQLEAHSRDMRVPYMHRFTLVRFEGIDLEFKDLMKSVSYCPTVVTFCSEVRQLSKARMAKSCRRLAMPENQTMRRFRLCICGW